MSFAEKNFRLFESWRLTKGHALRLLAVAGVLFVMLIVGEAVIGIGGFLLLGGPARLEEIAKLVSQPQQMFTAALPIIIVFGLTVSVLSVLFYALVGGAWAQIYRDLNPKLEEVF
jgi:hypothetical protein